MPVRKLFAPVLAILLGFTAVATAQQYGFLLLSTLTGAERIIVNNGGATITGVTAAQLRDAGGYVVAAPVSGSTVQAANNASMLSLQPAGTIAALTVALPTVPFDGQRVQIFSSQAITALTLTASPGTVSAAGAVTALTAGQSIEYFYVASTATWNRIQ